MKKYTVFWACLGLFFAGDASLQAQLLSPSEWESFISTNNTTLVSDTFRMQRFENTAQDNWRYVANEFCSIIDASLPGPSLPSGGKLLKMDLGGSLSFNKVFSPLHQTIKGGINFSAKNLMKNEYLEAVLYEPDKTDRVVLIQSDKDNYNTTAFHITVNRSLFGIDLHLPTPATNTKQGYCYIDSVYLFGNIPLYSLFKGKASWNDTTAWSHLPAERHRHALVKGEIAVDSDVHCDRVDLQGELTVAKQKRMSMQELTIHGERSVVRSEGELWIGDKINLVRTFPEKGVWYFVSFPFDVYADGIDPAFTLKDDTPNNGGNYFYVLTYNSKARSEELSMNDYWEVLPEAFAYGNNPVFEKNKGYLFAIDDQAETTTIRFSSRPGVVPPTYGKSGELMIDIPYSIIEENANTGWYLCGNPLPSPLPVRQLKHPDLDGYVYVFNGENYLPYSFDENYTLPPYSAFFLKAKRSVELSVNLEEPSPISLALTASPPLRGILAEPQTDLPTSNTVVLDNTCFQMEENSFFINNPAESGRIVLFDAMGRILLTFPFTQGEYRHIPLPEQPGFYILLVQTQNGRKEYKFTR